MTGTTRPCTVFYRNNRVKATFHQFGTKSWTDDGHHPHSKTIAVVELEAGDVIHAEPREVTFTDKG